MHGISVNRRGLRILAAVCAAATLPLLLAFIVNVELGLRVFWPSAVLLSPVLPSTLFDQLAVFSVDLSAVSTLVPLLLVVFPLAQALRVLQRPADDHVFLRSLTAVPYPVHFAFFLVMLGLVGTLHGMWIGLRTSGLATIGAQAASPDAIQQTLDRLLDGTATAIISSLVGIIAAFLAARPIPWIFRQLLHIEADPDRRTLSQTLEQLNHDLSNLGDTTRRCMAELEHLRPARVAEQLAQIRSDLGELAEAGRAQQRVLADILEQQRQDHTHLAHLATLAQSSREQTDALREAVLAVRQMHETQEQGTQSISALLSPLADLQRQSTSRIETLTELLSRTADEQRTDRTAFKRALTEWSKG